MNNSYHRAYEWLLKNPSRAVVHAAMKFHVDQDALRRWMLEKHRYTHEKIQAKRGDRRFKEACKHWPDIKRELNTTNERALTIARRYGYGQHMLNRLYRHFAYDIDSRANRVRQENRAKTLEAKGAKVVRRSTGPVVIDGARYMAVCMKWSNAA